MECLKHPKAVAWGEMGLDFHYDNSPRDVQMEVFVKQLQRAVEINKPIVIHSRKAEDETYAILKEHMPKVDLSRYYLSIYPSISIYLSKDR